MKLSADIYQSYAEKVLSAGKMDAGTYTTTQLNAIVLQLPFAEAHLALTGKDAASAPRLGDNLTVQELAQTRFFDIVGGAGNVVINATLPFLIKREHLEALEHWRDWRTLEVYLGQHDLDPSIVFRNKPISRKVDVIDREDWYLADLRVLFNRKAPVQWAG